MENNQYKTIKDVTELPNELKDFNWAAFLLTFIWGFKYKAWITFLAIPLILIQLPLGLNWLLLAVLQLYCGRKGNEWAYKQDFWKKSKDFRITQMKWAAVALTLYIIFPLVLLTISNRFFKNPNNLIDYIQNAQCVIAQKNLKKDIKKLNININTSSKNIDLQLKKIYNIPPNQTTITNIKNPKIAQEYTIQIQKPTDTLCNVTNKNCMIVYSFALPRYTTYINECGFYFDNYKQVIPSEKTQKYINKGLNVFKYLK